MRNVSRNARNVGELCVRHAVKRAKRPQNVRETSAKRPRFCVLDWLHLGLSALRARVKAVEPWLSELSELSDTCRNCRTLVGQLSDCRLSDCRSYCRSAVGLLSELSDTYRTVPCSSTVGQCRTLSDAVGTVGYSRMLSEPTSSRGTVMSTCKINQSSSLSGAA